MTDRSVTTSQRAYARLAGFMYLFVFVMYMLGELMTHAHWDRVGLCCKLISSLCTIPLAIGLYVALRPVSTTLALTALLLRVVEAVLGGLSISLAFAFFRSYGESTHASAFITDQLQVLLKLNVGIMAFSFGSTIFFYLFLRARYIPSILAVWGIFASLAGVAVCLINLMAPQYPVMTIYWWLPIIIAEISTGLWLLIKTVNIQPTGHRSPDPSTA